MTNPASKNLPQDLRLSSEAINRPQLYRWAAALVRAVCAPCPDEIGEPVRAVALEMAKVADARVPRCPDTPTGEFLARLAAWHSCTADIERDHAIARFHRDASRDLRSLVSKSCLLEDCPIHGGPNPEG